MRARILELLLVCCTGCVVGRPLERAEVPREALARTDARALGGKWRNRTMYCVGPDGAVTETTTTRTSGDPGLDRLYRETVAQWRFSALASRIRGCREADFAEDFGKDRTPEWLVQKQGAAKCDEDVVAAVTTYKPTPPVDAVARIVKEADIHDWMFITRVAFCVETDGTVSDVETFRGTGLPGLDRLARASVATWQFRPYTVQGVPKRICSQAIFRFRIQ